MIHNVHPCGKLTLVILMAAMVVCIGSGRAAARSDGGYVAVIYEHGDYGGENKFLTVGRYGPSELGIGDNRLSSISVAAGYRAVLFDQPDFSGRQIVVTGDVRWVGDDFNDRTSSIIIERDSRHRESRPHRKPADDTQGVAIYQHGDFQGQAQRLSVGRYTISDLEIGNDQLSSLIVLRGYRVILFEHGDFTGRRKVFTGEAKIGWVGDDFNDLTSSIIVERVR